MPVERSGRAGRGATRAKPPAWLPVVAPKAGEARRSRWEPIYRVVRRIPRGRVATYGQVAILAGRPRHARQVGYALHALPEGSNVPWHRVVNAAGRSSLGRRNRGGELSQRFRLEREGVAFDAAGRIDLRRYGWRPAVRVPAARR